MELDISLLLYTILACSVYWIIRKTKVDYDDMDVIIIGAGISGINAGKKLLDIGVNRYTIFEAGKEIGGTWSWNKYPGCACDVPAVVYNFSWHYNPFWSRSYPSTDEIQEYIIDAARTHNIHTHIKFGIEVSNCTWNEKEHKWSVTTSSGKIYKANFVISAVGGLCKPSWPTLAGAEEFQGIKVHTARWDPTIDLKNKRVGVIGTGCSSAQLLPAIQPIVDQIVLFQRTPALVAPKFDALTPEEERTDSIWMFMKNVYRKYTTAYGLDWSWLKATVTNKFYSDNETMIGQLKDYMKSIVVDPVLREKALPDYKLGVRRAVFSGDYLQAFNAKNFKLVTDKIDSFTTTGIKTQAEEVDLDVAVYATGFDSIGSTLSFETIGKDGKSLKSVWNGSPSAYKGISVLGFPNYFLMFGPNTINNMMFMTERQSNYIADAILQTSLKRKSSSIVKQEVFHQYDKRLKEDMKNRTYYEPGGYYADKNGGNWLLWPYSRFYYWWITKSVTVSDYDWF